MTEMLGHRECSESLGAYALGALPEPESERMRRHLTTCHQCRAELEGMRAAVDALPASVPQIEPPPELKARLMEIVEAEAELLRAAGEPADHPASAPPVRRRRWLPGPITNPGLVVACACIIALAIVVGVLGSSNGPGPRTIQAQVSSHFFSSGTRAKLQVNGTRAQLVVSGLPAPAPGRVDELWVKRGAAAPQPAGTFIVQSGSVKLTRPVSTGDLVLMTVERAPGTNAPTSSPLIVARA